MKNNEFNVKFSNKNIDHDQILRNINPESFDAEIDTAVFNEDTLCITFKNDLKYVDARILYNFMSISSFEFPESIERIKGFVTGYATGKTAQADGKMVVANGCLVAFHPDDCEKEAVVPEGITKIAMGAFNGCSDIKKVILPESLEEIGDSAFVGAGLSSIKFPKKLKIIGKHAFEKTSLGSVKIPDEVTHIDEFAFHHCDKLKKVAIGKNVTYIGAGAFSECRNLVEFSGRYATDDKKLLVNDKTLLAVAGLKTDLVLPENIEEIAPKTFYKSKSEVTVHLPANLRKIGDYAFYFSTLNIKNPFPDNLESIGEYAFAKCGIKRVILPDSLSELGEGVFAYCENLISFEGKYSTPDSKYLVKDNILIAVSIDDTATGADIPEDVTVIGKGAFTTCNARNIVLPEGITEIHERAFAYDSPLYKKIFDSIKLPSTLKTIGNAVFYCTCILKGTLEFSEGLLSIGASCFYTTELGNQSLSFPATLKSIGKKCFFNTCYGKKMTIDFNSLEVPEGIVSDAYGYPKGVCIRIPAASKEAYLKKFEILKRYCDDERYLEDESNIKFDFKD